MKKEDKNEIYWTWFFFLICFTIIGGNFEVKYAWIGWTAIFGIHSYIKWLIWYWKNYESR